MNLDNIFPQKPLSTFVFGLALGVLGMWFLGKLYVTTVSIIIIIIFVLSKFMEMRE